MTTMVTEVYDALREAGASEEKARRAAEALTGYDERSGHIEARLGVVEGRLAGIEGRLAGFDARLSLMQWAIGLLVPLQIATTIKLFVHG